MTSPFPYLLVLFIADQTCNSVPDYKSLVKDIIITMKLLFFVAVKCQAIPVPPKAQMTGDGCQKGSPAEFGTTCSFEYQPGYKRIAGSRSITCKANKQWSDLPLQCEG